MRKIRTEIFFGQSEFPMNLFESLFLVFFESAGGPRKQKKGFWSKIHFLLQRRPKKGFNVSLEGWSLSIKCLLKGQGVKNSTGFFHQLLYPVLNFAVFSTWPDLLNKTRRQSYECLLFTNLWIQVFLKPLFVTSIIEFNPLICVFTFKCKVSWLTSNNRLNLTSLVTASLVEKHLYSQVSK